MLHSMLAVLGGFATMAVLVMIGTMLATAALVPGGLARMRSGESGGPVPSGYLAGNLIISLLGAILGGFLTVRIAATSPLAHTLALAAFVLLMSGATMMQSRGKPANGQPSWYPGVIAVIGVGGVLLGGLLVA